MSDQDFNPDTHILGDDGQIYERKIVSATGVAAGMHVHGQEKSALNKKLEAAMTKTVEYAIAEGVNDPEEVHARILETRDRTLAEDLAEHIQAHGIASL
jgi:hypothetical protein